jgi:hypothetical protein
VVAALALFLLSLASLAFRRGGGTRERSVQKGAP